VIDTSDPLTRECERLAPMLKRLARKVGRVFPRHLLSEEDLVQEGFYRLLWSARWSASEIIQCRIAKNGMLDALRRLRDTRYPRTRQLEVGVEHIERIAIDPRPVFLEDYVDFVARLPSLSSRHQYIVRCYALGYSLKEIGEELNLTEGRVSQELKAVRQYLRGNSDE